MSEPIGVVSWHEGTVMGSIFPLSNMPKDGDLLYTHSKEWKKLTHKDICEITDRLDVSLILDCSIKDFVNAINDKLKEKNT